MADSNPPLPRRRLVKVSGKNDANPPTQKSTPAPAASGPIRKFVPKVPVRKTAKKTVKQESIAEEGSMDPALQALLQQSRDLQSGPFARKFPAGDQKSTAVRVAFGFGTSAHNRPAFSAPKSYPVGEGSSSAGGVRQPGSQSKTDKVNSEPTFDVPEGSKFAEDLKSRPLKAHQDPWDYSKEYPLTLPLRRPHTGLQDEGASNSHYDEALETSVEELNLQDIGADEERLMFFQLPSSLPLGDLSALGPGTGSDPRPLTRLGEVQQTDLSRLPAGKIGKLRVYKSGAVKLHLGMTVLEALPGAKCLFHQELVAVNGGDKTCHFLGDVSKRVVLVPAMDQL